MIRFRLAMLISTGSLLAVLATGVISTPSVVRAAAGAEVPHHVMTGMHELCYVQPCYHPPQQVPLAETARLLNWAMPDMRIADAARKLGIRSYAYVDPSIQFDPKRDEAPLYSEDEATFLRGCDGRRATLRRGDLSGYLMDVGAPNYGRRVRSYVDKLRPHYDALFVDDLFASTDTWATMVNKPCSRSFTAEREGTFALWEQLAMPVIFNGLGNAPDDGRPDPHAQSALSGPHVIGGMYEFCLTTGDGGMDHTMAHKRVDGAWLSTENSHLDTLARDRLFFCYSDSGTAGDSPAGIDERAYVYASFLLVYKPEKSVLEMAAGTSRKRLSVFPEAQLVALDPLRPAPAGVDALRTSSGAYVREYRRCYLAGQDPQPCAAVVNPSASHSVPVALPAYRHALALNGGAIADGGSLRRDAAAPAALQPASGTILFR